MSADFSNLSQLQHGIPLDQAAAMTKTYRDNKEQILQPVYQGKNILSICETFNRDIFDTIISTPACAGIRIYFGMDDDLKIHSIIVAVNKDGEDILPVADGSSGTIGELGVPCPPVCPPPSPLNGSK